MAQPKTTTRNKPDFSELLGPRLKEGAFIALVATALLLTLALLSFDRNDPGWTYTGSDETVNNIVGLSGAWIADVFLFFFGFLSYLFPMMLGSQAWMIFRERETENDFSWSIFIFRGVGLILTVCAGTGIAAMHFYGAGLDYQYGSGGIIGSEIADLLIPVLSYVGATLVLVATFLFGLTAFLGISWLRVMDAAGSLSIEMAMRTHDTSHRVLGFIQEKREIRRSAKHRREALEKHVEKEQLRVAPIIEIPSAQKKEESKRVARERQGNLFRISAVDGLPALHLLDEQQKD